MNPPQTPSLGGPNVARLRVGVLGAGTMGVGIAVTVARSGHAVVLRDISSNALAQGQDSVRRFLNRSVELGKLEADRRDAALAGLEGTLELEALADCDIVIEAILEDTELKAKTFGQLDSICREDALFHTNTSTLSVTAIAAGSSRPERVVGTHYCNPAPMMPLVEVARGQRTGEDAYERTLRFIETLDKRVVTTADVPGFLVNRYLVPFENDCIRALETNLGTVESIDAAVTKGLRYPMGPFTLLDIVGLDIHKAVSMSLFERMRDPRCAPPPLVDRMIAAGQLGRKTGEGFYTYADSKLKGT
jgi:3-hydroxybutyryl-CoA dehydrogenase